MKEAEGLLDLGIAWFVDSFGDKVLGCLSKSTFANQGLQFPLQNVIGVVALFLSIAAER